MTYLLKSLSLLLGVLFCTLNAEAQRKHSFEIKNGEFMYDQKPVRIISGEMHYARIPHEYWKHRMQMLKAMGLNTVATYVFWNLHEPEPDKWDFSGDKNLREFIKTAQEEGLHVILRVGPYACAEWEFGGYPWWLQNVKGLELRRDNEQFLHYTNLYIKRLYQEVKDLLITNGGPIIMTDSASGLHNLPTIVSGTLPTRTVKEILSENWRQHAKSGGTGNFPHTSREFVG